MILDDSIISKQSFINILNINGDATLSKPAALIKLNALSADLTFTLPPVTKQFELFGFIEIVRTDNFTNINNLCKIVAQNPTDLNETNNEIILDIFTSVKLYADLTTGKWQSVDQFSERRINELLTRSTGSYISGFDQDNFTSINTTAHAYETANILQAGTGWIYDRSSPNDEYIGRPYKVSWTAENDLDTSPANQNGLFLIYIDKQGNKSVDNVNNLSILIPFNNGGVNSNTHIQLATFSRDAGEILSLVPVVSEVINLSKRIDEFLDAVGTINSPTDPLGIAFNGANIKLNFTSGRGILRSTGFLGVPRGLSPDLEVLENDVLQSTILTATRDNLLQTILTDINVTQIEDPNNPGTLITMTNNRAKLNFYKGFPTEQFLGEILGQAQYLTVQAAFDSNEAPMFPNLVDSGFTLQSVCVLKDETDLTANAKLKTNLRMNLTL